MKKVIQQSNLWLLLFALVSFSATAQQVPLNNFYIQNPFSINPAATGIHGNIAGYVSGRDQWTGLKGAPENKMLGLHGLFTGAMGLGISAQQNSAGLLKQSGIDLNYSYRLNLADSQSLSFGAKFGFLQNTMDYDNLQIGNKADPTVFNSKAVNESHVRAGFGLHYNMKNLNVHFSSPLLYSDQEKRYLQTAYGLASYDFYFAENIWKVQPSVMFRYTDRSKNQFDMNLLAEWSNRVWGLGSYRTNGNMLLGAGVFAKGIGIGYVYEFTGSDISIAAGGTHEVMIHFEANRSMSKKTPYYKSSRRTSERE